MQCGGRPPGPGQDTPYVDVYNEKPVRVATKVVVPIKQHPKVSKNTETMLFKVNLLLIKLTSREVINIIKISLFASLV